jgi:cyclic pyranopterin phosphate synthase
MQAMPLGLPAHVSPDRTLRVKILDACGMTCTFCHNEGTPVAVDNRTGRFTAAGRSGRVSIYLGTNGATFVPATIEPESGFSTALGKLRDALGYDELHLTGGEPTLHPRLADLVAEGKAEGYSVRMTSNGENGARAIPAAAASGLEKVNFSIFGTTGAELADVQAEKYWSIILSERKIAALKTSIQVCADVGIGADANIVVPDYSHADRIRRLLHGFSDSVSIRLLNSLDSPTSVSAVQRILHDLRATPTDHYLTAGASGSRTKYRLPDGREIYFKRIRPVRLPRTCASCRFNDDKNCQEGFYGIRLYLSTQGCWMIGVCIQRMDLCLELGGFLIGRFPEEIRTLRKRETLRLRRDTGRGHR